MVVRWTIYQRSGGVVTEAGQWEGRRGGDSQGLGRVGSRCSTRSVRKVSDRIFLCEHLMDYNLARLHEPTLNLSAHA